MGEQHEASFATKVTRYVIAGGIAGGLEVLSLYPLDVIKTRMQLATTNMSVGQMSTALYNEGGMSIFYRGIISPLLAEAPKRACKFTFNQIYKPIFKGDQYVLGAGASGAAAGMTEAFINCPFEVVKVRLQSKTYKSQYSGVLDGVRQMLQQEGAMSLYRGIQAQLWRNGVWNGVYFASIMQINGMLPAKESKSGKLFNKFIAGFIGGSLATASNTPFDVAKSLMQNEKSGSTKYNGTLQTISTLYKEQGLKACYRGLMPRIYRLGPGGGIMIVAFDFIS
eukprot:CAMPEP_0117430084 /NCGR_PEP_ID=MMETSP0758-20121206/9601_1 /TAXON_ID=63605 /ORGANISM="Percolomonas cosmopolitus, Strain AE-1 (ATCC 50343)" /LENGTH=279 /DNA_ID=CAMNT_0005217705 /DNA_START=9 /DNA_END=844 /DNA_ORIENTATION=+